MLVVGIFLLLFIGYLNADIPAECGYAIGSEKEGCVRAKTSAGIEFAYKVHDELLIWSLPRYFDKMVAGSAVAGNTFIYRYSIAVMEQSFSPDYVLPIDVTVFNFPSFWYYFNNQRNLRVALHPERYYNCIFFSEGSYVYFTDEKDKCRAHRPTELKLDNFLNMDLYLNRKHARYSYFFIKKDSFICAYAFEHQDL
uniref:Uncharacterized protein n=1 Tax=Panagrolaimus sp. PS1159 TaxID=55785 RepID=A0AC35ETB2_9BILA